MSHFGNIGHHLIVAIIDIYRPYTQWLGDVQWGHLMAHVGGRVCEISEELMEGDDQLLARVCSERLAVFPVNVTRDEQRQSLQSWFSKLPAVQNPGALLGYDGPGCAFVFLIFPLIISL